MDGDIGVSSIPLQSNLRYPSRTYVDVVMKSCLLIDEIFLCLANRHFSETLTYAYTITECRRLGNDTASSLTALARPALLRPTAQLS